MTTLQQCALSSLRRHLSVYNVLEAFRLAQQFEVTDWGRELQEACITFVKDTYETLRDITSRAELEEHFGQAFVQQLELQVLQRQQLLRSLSIRGQVAEHAPPVLQVVPAAAAEEQGQASQVEVSVLAQAWLCHMQR
ncbi:hypothetical protein OEZ85_014212 [Tetradesmus obliquus]|uniref:Uncharacterized protein n=1 Tax=Tetradesmus obliquus TaxID=3088 RepID=A0ABY8U7B1_TETOB|nr:hypothetical protein OEZ85_014212 [Tetradesmus obliquus]